MHVLRYPGQVLQGDSSHEPRHVTQVKAFCNEEICGFLKSDDGIATAWRIQVQIAYDCHMFRNYLTFFEESLDSLYYARWKTNFPFLILVVY